MSKESGPRDTENTPTRVQDSDKIPVLRTGMPDIPGYELYAFYEPAQQVGGDYYGVIPLPPESRPNHRIASSWRCAAKP